MILESVRIFGRPKNQYLASAEIIISEGNMRFCVRGLRLIDLGNKHPHLAMPAWKKEGMEGPVFEDMFFPMTKTARDFLEEEIVTQYLAYAYKP